MTRKQKNKGKIDTTKVARGHDFMALLRRGGCHRAKKGRGSYSRKASKAVPAL